MKYLFLLSVLFLSLSCKKKNQVDQAKKDDEIILKYISDHKLNATPTGTGLYYLTETSGNGVKPTSNSQVKVAYKGYFTDGSVFDQSESNGIIFGLNEVIKGWTEGIPYFNEGGTGKLLIPSALGYGEKGNSSIPGNTVLIFDINLIKVY
jgi:FKBP-type peptidyl-prolyl cis-trans isomerase FkpA